MKLFKKHTALFLFIALACASLSHAQQYNKKLLFVTNYQKATVLNGTSQYWTKSSPSNLDLNGSEMITNANNTGFETNIGNWANFGNHSAVRSTVDKRTGTASMKITSSAAGDTTANFMYLPPSALGTIVSGNKYTIELWARSATATSTITINIGTQSATSGTLSTTFGTFTKAVFTFTATSGSDTLKIYANKAIDSLYVDDVSLTQSYDMLLNVLIKSSDATAGGIVSTGDAGSASNVAWRLIGRGDNVNKSLQIQIADGNAQTGNAVSSTINVIDGKVHVVSAVIGSSIFSLYVDGVLSITSAITTIGKVPASNLFVGISHLTSTFHDGQIGFVQIVRFTQLPSNIAQTVLQISQQKKPMSSYTNGQIVAWYDWKSGGTDKSGSGNHLTPVASPPIVNIQR